MVLPADLTDFASFLGSEEKPLGNTDVNQRNKLVNPLI